MIVHTRSTSKHKQWQCFGLHNEARCGLIVAVDLWSICDAPVLSACRPTSALCECQHAIMFTENVFVGVKQKTILIRRRVTLLNISTAKMHVDLTDIRYVVRINLLYRYSVFKHSPC